MRERYGFTAKESLEMSVIEFEEWLAAVSDEENKEASEGDEVWENVSGQ